MTGNTTTQRDLKELYASAYKLAFPTYTLKPREIGFIIETETGELIHVEKPQIEKRFCYADHLEDAHECARLVCTDEEFFIFENTTSIRRDIEDLEKGEPFYIIPREESPILARLIQTRYCRIENKRAYLLPDEDRARALEVYKLVLADFEKRLRSYVKRYGLKHVHSWTYWADA